MCGIVGAVANSDIVPTLLEGLRRLEYRGYDSAGIAINNGGLHRLRTIGRVAELSKLTSEEKLSGHIGIAHTRWATHGAPSERNAHPHFSGTAPKVAVVHNGIIENHETLRERLQQAGFTFSSDTDTEVIAHLITLKLRETPDLFKAVCLSLTELQGAYAIAVMEEARPERIIVCRNGAPLLLGLGDSGIYAASDASALLQVTRRMIYLEEGDVAELSREGYRIVNCLGDGKITEVTRTIKESELTNEAVELGPYAHFMQKEIFEQPGVVANTLEMVANARSISPGLFGSNAEDIFRDTRSILILACGTSYHAGLVARYWMEAVAGLPCNVEIASEYRYRSPAVNPGHLGGRYLPVGRNSGYAGCARLRQIAGAPLQSRNLQCGRKCAGAANRLAVPDPGRARIGVASTKAFTTQLAALMLLTMTMARLNGKSTEQSEREMIGAMRHLPVALHRALQVEPQVKAWAERFYDKKHALFLGRGMHYPIAMEGALKLKEISYIHAEAYAAGELKHGPLALVDKDMPVVAIAPNDALLEKLKSNLQEVRARGGELYVFADADSQIQESEGVHIIRLTEHAGLPAVRSCTYPLLQLLAYHVALQKRHRCG